MPPVVIPEQGQLVEVRHRRYVVAHVTRSTLERRPLDQDFLTDQHLVSLTSVEDDARGEGLQVIWELEPGARLFDQRALPNPTGFDPPARLDAFLNAVRWGVASAADVQALQAPFRSGVAIEDYQLEPVVRAIQMPRTNLLIADDVGLGKTIEAGLVVQELLIRHRARRVLIVVPAALQIQWRDQMREKFGLEFRIVDSELMRSLRRSRGIHVNPWSHFPRLITSIDYLKRDQPIRLFRETLPANGAASYPRSYDLLIVDEAHNVAPSGLGAYAIDSLRTAAIRTLAPHFEHRLFLTATPHNGYPESFTALLELLDNQRFARGVPPDPQVLQRVLVRRLKSEMKVSWSGRPLFPTRELTPIEVNYSADERQAHQQLQAYTQLRSQRASDTLEQTATEFVLKLLKKRLLSSPAAFATTLEKHCQALTPSRPAPTPPRRPQAGILKQLLAGLDESFGSDEEYAESTGEALQLTSSLFRPATPDEQALLDAMLAWANQARRRPDSKAQALLAWVKQLVRPNGVWSDVRVIIFSEYRDTQKWLQDLLAAEGLSGAERLMLLYGGMLDDDRERVKAAFQADPRTSQVRILLATDAASEGIDLQRYCHRLIHYEIPWNPNRMEQRNGRIDRHGQQQNPQVLHFVPAGFAQLPINRDTPVGDLEGDVEFLMRAVQKVEQIREDLGKVGPVIAEQVVDAMLGRRRTLDTAHAERDAAPARQMLRFERNLAEQIRALYEQLQASRQELHLAPENVAAVVQIALELAGQPPLLPATLAGVWPDPNTTRRECPVFRLPELTGAWRSCAEGLNHPHTGAPRPLVFDHDLARGRDDVVLAHLNHPLVQMAVRLLRAEVWGGTGQQQLQRVAARVVPRHVATTPLVVAYGRLLIIGGDSQRLHEELIAVGGEIGEQSRFRRLNVGQTQAAIAAMTDREPRQLIKDDLLAVWPRLADGVNEALKERANKRSASLQRKLDERRDQELTDIQRILEELDLAIRRELRTAEAPVQLELNLFNQEEREQLNRNLDALRTRLAQIPAELSLETSGIHARYADPQSRLFPVAVVFLVPESLA